MSGEALQSTSGVTPLSRAQHKAALWADAGQNVYAVVMGSRVPGLPALLAGAGREIVDHDCLLPGALEPDLQQRAHHLVWLKAESAFTDWLLFEAGALGHWGLLLRSPARLLTLRNHLRGLLRALLPGGQAVNLEWMDPPVLQAILPLFGPAELSAFFGPVRSLTVPSAAMWSHAEPVAGRLMQQDVPLAKIA